MLAAIGANMCVGIDCRYATWAAGGIGMSITGNVMVDRRYLECPGNVALEDDSCLPALTAWARAAKGLADVPSRGAPHRRVCAVMQISHPGRQVAASVAYRGVAPSSVPVRHPALGRLTCLIHGTPAPLSVEEVRRRLLLHCAVLCCGSRLCHSVSQIHAIIRR